MTCERIAGGARHDSAARDGLRLNLVRRYSSRILCTDLVLNHIRFDCYGAGIMV